MAIPSPPFVLLMHVKAVRLTLVAAPVSGEPFFWTFWAHIQKLLDARPFVLSISHTSLQILCPQLTFIIMKEQASRWPATNSFPNRDTSFLFIFFFFFYNFQRFICGRKRVLLIKEIGWVSNKAWREKVAAFSEASASFCFISKAIHEAQKPYMFMKAQGCL